MQRISISDLLHLGPVCGLVGTYRQPSEIVQLLPKHVHYLLFCFSNSHDINLFRALEDYASSHPEIRLILIYNPCAARHLSAHLQSVLDQIIDQVDMILESEWAPADLPLAVATYSNTLIIGDLHIWENHSRYFLKLLSKRNISFAF